MPLKAGMDFLSVRIKMLGMDNYEKLINLLNDLVVVNNDRVEGYESAASEAKDLALKGLFEAMARDSRTFASELSIKIAQLGGKITVGTSTAGSIYRAWMAIKATITAHDRKAILSSCEEGENVALEAYNQVLGSEVELSDEIRQIVIKQKEKLQEGHDSIVKLKEHVYA